jgi:hypothetical protein
VKKEGSMRSVTSVLLAIGIMFMCASSGECQREKHNLYTALWDVSEIKVYVADVTDSSGAAGDMVRGIKEQLEHALEARMSLNFKIVRNKEDADLIITTDVVERVWADHDPIDTDDMPPGWFTVVMDAAEDNDYGRIQAVITVERGPTDRLKSELVRLRRKNILWTREVSADVTKENMTEEESKPFLEMQLAEVFVYKCFGKNAKMYSE